MQEEMLRDYFKKGHIKIFRNFTLLVVFALLMVVPIVSIEASVANADTVTVVRVIDGDTVVLSDNRHVRLLGINTPEISHHKRIGEPGGVMAKNALKSLLKERTILLETDIEQVDHYGRTLAYLFTLGGVNINQKMVREGLATLNLYPPNLKYSKQLLLAQEMAEVEGLGIWGMSVYDQLPVESIVNKKSKRWGRFVAKVTAISIEQKGVKLWLGEKVYIWLKKPNLDYFPLPQSYLNKEVEIRGWPRKWGKYWSIDARHPSQIIIHSG